MNRTLACVLTVVAAVSTAAAAQDDHVLQASVHKALADTGAPRTVVASVSGGFVSLTGSVPLLRAKLQVEAALAGLQGVQGIRDAVRVDGPAVNDARLYAALEKRVRDKKVTFKVHDGQVVLGSRPLDPASASATLLAVASTPGVRAISDSMNVTQWGPEPGLTTYGLSTVP